jgi:hypothetical protein
VKTSCAVWSWQPWTKYGSDREPRLLPSMKSDERRVVHELVSDIPDITSATEGVEPRKRIVLLPTPASDEEEEE